MDEDLLNAEQVADLLQLSRRDATPKQKREALAYYRRQTKFPEAATVGGKLLWLKSEIIAHFKEQRRVQLTRKRKEGPKDLGDGGAPAMRVRRKLQKEEGLLDEE
jgi:hypothetical protein